MNRTRVIGLLASSALAALVTMAFAAGAEPADESTSSEHSRNAESADTAEVVVTAQRRKERLSDVGMTVVSVDGELLNERRIDTAADLTQVVSALSVAENADGTRVYTLRGVGFNSTSLGAQPSVSTYQDEAPLPYGPMTQGPLFDLERVEVLKGPQGTLYGQNSTGGAINYIAAKPTDHFSTGVNASLGRFATFQGQGFVSGPLTEGLKARLSVDTTVSDDWQYSYTRNDSIGAQKKFAARLLLDWQPTAAVRGSLNLNGWIDRSDNQVPQFVVAIPRVPANVLPQLLTLAPTPANPRAADWDPRIDFDRNNRQGQAVARFDLDLGQHLTLTS